MSEETAEAQAGEATAEIEAEQAAADEAREHGEMLGRIFAPRIKSVAAALATVLSAELMSRPNGPAGMPPSLAGELRLSDEVRAAILESATRVVCCDALANRLSGISAPVQALAGAMLDGRRASPSPILTPSGPLNNPNRVNGKRKGKRK